MSWPLPRPHHLIPIALVLVFSVPTPTRAYNPDAIISDRGLTNHASMSLVDVQRFLQDRSSTLATAFLPDSDGALKVPAEIVWFASQEAVINPQVLLTMLQKEQSLIADPKPSTRQYDWAMGYGCPDSSGCNERFRGFGKQVRGAALQLRGYLDDLRTRGETIARWAVGRPKQTSDGFTVTPRNAATAALFSYTPWRGGPTGNGGNYSFARLWDDWFGDGGGRYPDGAILRDPSGASWRIQGGKRRQFATLAVLRSRAADAKAITVSPSDLSAYEIAPPIRFTNYQIVEDQSGIRWLLVDATRRRLASSEVFRQLGYNPEEVESASADDLSAYAEGAVLTSGTDDPRGTLVLDAGSGKEYILIGAVKHPILHEAIRASRFSGRTVQPVPSTKLAAYRVGDTVRFADGELVTSPKYLPRAFVISQGKRRPFVSPRVLEQLGYQWSNLIVTSDAALDIHPEGDEITGGFVADGDTAAPPVPVHPAPTPYVPTVKLENTPAFEKGLSLF